MVGFGRLTILLPFFLVIFSTSFAFSETSNKNYEIQITKLNQVLLKNNYYKPSGNIVEKQRDGKDRVVCSFPDDDNKDVVIEPNSNTSISFSCGSRNAKYYLTNEGKNFLINRIVLHFDFYDDHSQKDFEIQKVIFDPTAMLF